MKKNFIRLLFFLILLLSNTLTKSFSQARKIDLKEVEVEEKKARYEDALHATRAAIEGGIVAGGGVR